MPTLTQELRSLPDKHRALLLLGVLLDSENVEEILSIDERAYSTLAPLSHRILSVPEPARKALILTYLQDSLSSLRNLDE